MLAGGLQITQPLSQKPTTPTQAYLLPADPYVDAEMGPGQGLRLFHVVGGCPTWDWWRGGGHCTFGIFGNFGFYLVVFWWFSILSFSRFLVFSGLILSCPFLSFSVLFLSSFSLFLFFILFPCSLLCSFSLVFFCLFLWPLMLCLPPCCNSYILYAIVLIRMPSVIVIICMPYM